MDKNSIKKYAVWARRELISRVSQRALLYGISEKDFGDSSADTINGHLLTASEKRQRQSLIAKIKKDGYQQAMEAAAYTWFNRFSALRFMEVNGYLPSHVRVFTDEDNNFKPQILAEAIHLDIDGLDMEKVYEMKDANKTDELYKYLLITQCNALGAVLPGMFTRIEDYTELLFPDNLLREGSVIEQMIAQIPQEDWTDQVQIIGWLYQYYNAEPKDKVFENLKKNIKISKENIPAATQLFTPDWIVRYMVENSLGRLFVEGNRQKAVGSSRGTGNEAVGNSEKERIEWEKGIAEQMGWKYYLPEAEQEPEVRKQLNEIASTAYCLDPTAYKVIDPCMGSGHILVYMFDVLIQIYEAYGYNTREAAALILQNNLYGLDIDDRAAQLAYFAVMMKARQYDRRIFSRGIQPHVYAIVESNGITRDVIEYFENGRDDLKKALESILSELNDAKEYGSILNVTPVDFAALYARFDEISGDIDFNREIALNTLKPLVQVAEAMAQKYHAVVTNPPYMGSSGMSNKLSEYVKKNYPDSKSDLFAVFIERCGEMCGNSGYQAMITQHAWMFLSSFEKLREKLLQKENVNMVHLGARAFEEIGGEVVQTTSFVMQQHHISGYRGTYCRLIEPTTQQGKEDMFLAAENRHTARQDNFAKIPGSPIAYWLTLSAFEAFNGQFLDGFVTASVGIQTGDNDKFVHFWWEVVHNSICRSAQCLSDSFQNCKWYPYNKGGEFRKWAGNDYNVVLWKNDGEDVKNSSLITGHHYQQYADNLKFKPLITWSRITTGTPAFRYKTTGYLSDMAGFCLYANEKHLLSVCAFCNSSVASYYLAVLAPTLNIMTGQVLALPYKCTAIGLNDRINQVTSDNIEYVSKDWDSFETSWDFKRHPLI